MIIDGLAYQVWARQTNTLMAAFRFEGDAQQYATENSGRVLDIVKEVHDL